MAATGQVRVDYLGLAVGEYPAACYAQARQLFVVDPDLAPPLPDHRRVQPGRLRRAEGLRKFCTHTGGLRSSPRHDDRYTSI